MSWIQENKFVAGLIGVTAIIGGGIVYFGLSQGGAYAEKLESYEELKGQYASLEKTVPYPSQENLDSRERGIAQYGKSIEEVSAKLNAYGPESMKKLSPEQFNDARVKVSNDLRKAFAAGETELPAGTEFGFEKYASASAKSATTPKLAYQLGATEWLLTKLAAVKPSALNNINRLPLDVETGNAEEDVENQKPRRGRGKEVTMDVKPYETMPMELSFTANEASVRDFLKEMVSSEDYFYAIRALRIRNEQQSAPSEKDANFPQVTSAAPLTGGASASAADPFAGFNPGSSASAGDAAVEAADTPEPEPIKVSERILKQVLGNEELEVHVVFDVLLFKTKPAVAAAK